MKNKTSEISKIIFSFLILFFCISGLSAETETPMGAVAGIIGNSPRTFRLSAGIEKQLLGILRSAGRFDIVNSPLLKQELRNFKCLEEKCILRFARRAGFSLLIHGELDDRGDELFLVLSGYGMDYPFQGRLVYRYRARIPMGGGIGAREYNFITEEHAARFMAGFFNVFKLPASITLKNNGIATAPDFPVYGTLRVFRADISGGRRQTSYKYTGTVTRMPDGSIKTSGSVRDGDYILGSFKDKADFLKTFYEGRKRELIFKRHGFESIIYTILLAPIASAAMPVVNPSFGYYMNNDWAGLGLWSLNAAPWIYFEVDGFMAHRDIQKKNKWVTRYTRTNYAFAWYMAFAGGTSLFIDTLSHQYLFEASQFKGISSILGNSFLAGYFSVISGGGGHFYRGYRGWGYLYFQINNTLMYLTMYAFTPPAYEGGGSGKINRKLAWSLAGALGAVKIVEVIHAVLLHDKIRNGTVEEESFAFAPVFRFDAAGNSMWGIQAAFRF